MTDYQLNIAFDGGHKISLEVGREGLNEFAEDILAYGVWPRIDTYIDGSATTVRINPASVAYFTFNEIPKEDHS